MGLGRKKTGRQQFTARLDDDNFAELSRVADKQEAINKALRLFFTGTTEHQSIDELKVALEHAAAEKEIKQAEANQAAVHASRVEAALQSRMTEEEYRVKYLGENPRETYDKAIQVIRTAMADGRSNNEIYRLAKVWAGFVEKQGGTAKPEALIKEAGEQKGVA
jgi:hypothetical protein